jgi:hypothetical protein
LTNPRGCAIIHLILVGYSTSLVSLSCPYAPSDLTRIRSEGFFYVVIYLVFASDRMSWGHFFSSLLPELDERSYRPMCDLGSGRGRTCACPSPAAHNINILNMYNLRIKITLLFGRYLVCVYLVNNSPRSLRHERL